jgi:hypothetical protein
MMTVDDVVEILAVVREIWPHSKVIADDPRTTTKVWHGLLRNFDRQDVEEAIMDMATAGREHAPPVGVIAHAVALKSAGEAPDLDEGLRMLLRKAHSVYDPEASFTASHTAEAIRLGQEGGVHEAVLRFVAERGYRAVWALPDPSRGGLNMSQEADRRDLLRHYRDTTLPGWRANPTRGLALERAERAAGIDGGQDTRKLGNGDD